MPKRFCAVLALAATAAVAAPEPPSDAGATRGGGLKPFEGTVVAVDRKVARLSVEGASGTFPVSYDRDTAVYLEDRTGTPLDVAAGKRVRGATDAANRAYWIAVLPPPAPDAGKAEGTAPPSTPATAGPSPEHAPSGSSGSEPPPTSPAPRPAPPPPVGPGGVGPRPSAPGPR